VSDLLKFAYTLFERNLGHGVVDIWWLEFNLLNDGVELFAFSHRCAHLGELLLLFKLERLPGFVDDNLPSDAYLVDVHGLAQFGVLLAHLEDGLTDFLKISLELQLDQLVDLCVHWALKQKGRDQIGNLLISSQILSELRI
jgi:hypothetical protein